MRPSSRPAILALTAALALVAVALPAAPAFGQDAALRWSFRKDDTLRYLLAQESTTKTDFQGNKVETKNDQTFDVTWKVKSVRPDGSADMALTFDRVRFKAEIPPRSFAFDSNDEKADDPQVEALAKVFRALIGGEITLTMTPEGEVKDVKLPAKAVEALNNIPAPPGAPKLLSEDSIKNVIELATQPLPGKAVARGATWTKARETASPLGSMTAETTYTRQGPDETRPELERIGLKATLDLKVKPDLPLKATIKSQEVRGTALFDTKAGHLQSSTLDQNVALDLEAMGQSLVQETVTKIATTLKDKAE